MVQGSSYKSGQSQNTVLAYATFDIYFNWIHNPLCTQKYVKFWIDVRKTSQLNRKNLRLTMVWLVILKCMRKVPVFNLWAQYVLKTEESRMKQENKTNARPCDEQLIEQTNKQTDCQVFETIYVSVSSSLSRYWKSLNK